MTKYILYAVKYDKNQFSMVKSIVTNFKNAKVGYLSINNQIKDVILKAIRWRKLLKILTLNYLLL